jgi:hypothetical protein
MPALTDAPARTVLERLHGPLAGSDGHAGSGSAGGGRGGGGGGAGGRQGGGRCPDGIVASTHRQAMRTRHYLSAGPARYCAGYSRRMLEPRREMSAP